MSYEYPRLWINDVDETLFDTGKFFDKTAVVAAELGVVENDFTLHDARKQTEADGGSFDTDKYLATVLHVPVDERDILWTNLGDNKEGTRFLYPDAEEFLQTLDALGEPDLSLTYGGVRTQLAKLRSERLDERPYIITAENRKGVVIESYWNEERGLYVVTADQGENLAARTVMLTEDKAKGFDGLNERSSGFLVQRRAPKLSQMSTVPERITIVPSLAVVTQILRDESL